MTVPPEASDQARAHHEESPGRPVHLDAGGTSPAAAQAPRIPVLIDTDIGSDIDDAFALALALASPELDLRGDHHRRRPGRGPRLDRLPLPSHAGIEHDPGRRRAGAAAGLRRRLADPVPPPSRAVFNRTQKPVKEPAVEFMYEKLKAQPGKLTLIAARPAHQRRPAA